MHWKELHYCVVDSPQIALVTGILCGKSFAREAFKCLDSFVFFFVPSIHLIVFYFISFCFCDFFFVFIFSRRFFSVLFVNVTAVFVTFKLPFHNVFSSWLHVQRICRINLFHVCCFPSLYAVANALSLSLGFFRPREREREKEREGEQVKARIIKIIAFVWRWRGKINGVNVWINSSLHVEQRLIGSAYTFLPKSILPVQQVEMIEILTFNTSII